MIEYKVKVYSDRTVWYNSNDQLHRLYGPASEWVDGTKMWYLNDQLHREDGPAYEGANGSKHWCLNGKRHRLDGPAIEWADGDKYWFIEGEQLTEQEFLDRNKVELTLEEIANKFNIDVKQLKIKK